MIKWFNSAMLHRLIAVIAGINLSTAVVAHADASCVPLVQSKIVWLQIFGGSHRIEVTIRNDYYGTVYGRTTLALDSTQTWLVGYVNLLFSDRFSGPPTFPQPFDIRHLTWGFEAYRDLSCPGVTFLTSTQPGVNTMSVMFRDWVGSP